MGYDVTTYVLCTVQALLHDFSYFKCDVHSPFSYCVSIASTMGANVNANVSTSIEVHIFLRSAPSPFRG
jgi:hypothetical protein